MVCGVDEAGRGPVIGPLVIAGVILHDETVLSKYNIRDSKKITPKRRDVLEHIIKQHAEEIEVVSIPAIDIDDMRKVMTLNEIEVFAFTKVIKKLHPHSCYVDAADVNEKRFGEDISKSLPKSIKIISKHKADDIYPIVGAASIIAKTERDREIQKIANKLEKRLNIPLGSGYPSDPLTQTFLKKWVESHGRLPPHTRKSWNTSKRILLESKRKTLDEF